MLLTKTCDQPDPKHFEAGDYNLYRYCHNDPVNHTDPFGFQENSAANLAKRRAIDQTARSYKDSHKWDLNARLNKAFKERVNKCARFVHDTTKEAGATPPRIADKETGKMRSATAEDIATEKMKDWRPLKPSENRQLGDIAAYPLSGGGSRFTGHAGIITSGDKPGETSNISAHANGVYTDPTQFKNEPGLQILRYTGE